MYYFIGIKGTGMAALASILHDEGNVVEGSDLPKHFFTQQPLDDRKIKIYDFDPANIRDNMNVIIGNAFGEDDLGHCLLAVNRGGEEALFRFGRKKYRVSGESAVWLEEPPCET